jgi:hypothetical protein
MEWPLFNHDPVRSGRQVMIEKPKGDINDDGNIDPDDLKLVILDWLGQNTCQTFICDIFEDNKINLLDAALVILNLGK